MRNGVAADVWACRGKEKDVLLRKCESSGANAGDCAARNLGARAHLWAAPTGAHGEELGSSSASRGLGCSRRAKSAGATASCVTEEG
jgi:hypothetical protein